MDKKEETLKQIIHYLYIISNKVGQPITEYDWRECVNLISQLEDHFNDTYNITKIKNDIINGKF